MQGASTRYKHSDFGRRWTSDKAISSGGCVMAQIGEICGEEAWLGMTSARTTTPLLRRQWAGGGGRVVVGGGVVVDGRPGGLRRAEDCCCCSLLHAAGLVAARRCCCCAKGALFVVVMLPIISGSIGIYLSRPAQQRPPLLEVIAARGMPAGHVRHPRRRIGDPFPAAAAAPPRRSPALLVVVLLHHFTPPALRQRPTPPCAAAPPPPPADERCHARQATACKRTTRTDRPPTCTLHTAGCPAPAARCSPPPPRIRPLCSP